MVSVRVRTSAHIFVSVARSLIKASESEVWQGYSNVA